jgi:hypothetical protein
MDLLFSETGMESFLLFGAGAGLIGVARVLWSSLKFKPCTSGCFRDSTTATEVPSLGHSQAITVLNGMVAWYGVVFESYS